MKPLLICLLAVLAPLGARQAPTLEERQLQQAFEAQGLFVDSRAGLVSLPVQVNVRDDLLEYLLVGPAGAAHESLFSMRVPPSVLNTALLSIGAEPGRNATWRPKEPRPSDDELAQGVLPYEVEVPQGFGLYLYAAWKQAGELYFYRLEDLLRDLSRGRSMRRHKWVYLGSSFLESQDPKAGSERVFAADVYQNVICISYFSEAYVVLTAALPECVEQTIWMPNAWLLPSRGESVTFLLSREPLERVPEALRSRLTEVAAAAPSRR